MGVKWEFHVIQMGFHEMSKRSFLGIKKGDFLPTEEWGLIMIRIYQKWRKWYPVGAPLIQCFLMLCSIIYVDLGIIAFCYCLLFK